MYVRYIRDSVYLYDLFKQHPAPGLGTRSTATRPGYEAWVRGQLRAYFLLHMAVNELNCTLWIDRRD